MKGFVFVMLIAIFTHSQAQPYTYEAKQGQEYGLRNPLAPIQIKDWDELIGTCNCKSVSRLSPQNWADTVDMIWKWKYIMDGWAVQDETLKADGVHSGSIRQYNSDSAQWYVHYYSNKAATSSLSAWSGNRSGDEIILYKEQKAPNGADGFYKIVFSNISVYGFHWTGAWVNEGESIIYPTWRIFCTKSIE